MNFNEFIQEASRRFGLCLEGYKEAQLKRRIDSLVSLSGAGDYRVYLRLIVAEPEEKKRFLDKITINVSEFFRNQEIFDVLLSMILPQLLAERSGLRIWSAGCANGAEPYSMAIILEELEAVGWRMEATDIDEKILAAAREGKYKPDALRNVSKPRLARFFSFDGSAFHISDALRKRIVFRRQDLLRDNYGSGYDLIVCRNVAIYFTREVQDALYRKFRDALRHRGILFIGATENIWKYQELGLIRISPWFYRKESKE